MTTRGIIGIDDGAAVSIELTRGDTTVSGSSGDNGWGVAPSQTFNAPTATGSGIAAPLAADWVALDAASANGDIISLDIVAEQLPEAENELTYYEVAISTPDGNTSIERLLGGPYTGITRLKQVAAGASVCDVYIRNVQHKINQMSWRERDGYEPQVGDTVSKTDTAATGTVVSVTDSGGGFYTLTLGNMVGDFTFDEANDEVFVNNRVGEIHTWMAVGHDPDFRETVRSEWSAPKRIDLSTGAPSVTVVASKINVVPGEAVFFTVLTSGFQCERPMHDLHFYFHVDKAGEQGEYDSLQGLSFKEFFGDASKDRNSGYSSIWSFAPQTTGPVEVKCTVRDRSGNVVTDSVTLNSQSLVDAFLPSEVHAVSSAGTVPPEFPAATIHADYESARQGFAGTAKALLLLDNTEVHGDGTYDRKNTGGDRLVVMPFDAGGSGVNASQRAELRWQFESNKADVVLYGIDSRGPFDATGDPYNQVSGVHPKGRHGLAVSDAAHVSLSNVSVVGWDYNIQAPLTGNVLAVHDFYNYGAWNFGVFWTGEAAGAHSFAGAAIGNFPESWRAAGRGEDTFPVFTDHGPYRASRPEGVRGFSRCRIFTSVSWGGKEQSQPALRFFGNAGTPFPHPVHMSQIYTEAAREFSIITTSTGGRTTPGRVHPQDICIDKLVNIPALQGGAVVLGVSGVTIRNAVIAVGDSTPYNGNTGSPLDRLVYFNAKGAGKLHARFDGENQPVVLEHITFADLRSDGTQATASSILWQESAGYPLRDVRWKNTIHYAPNFASSGAAISTDLEPLSRTPQTIPDYKGRYDWDFEAPAPQFENQSPDFSFASDPNATATFAPAAGSSAFQSGGFDVPYDDIKSVPRPIDGTASKGPVSLNRFDVCNLTKQG